MDVIFLIAEVAHRTFLFNYKYLKKLLNFINKEKIRNTFIQLGNLWYNSSFSLKSPYLAALHNLWQLNKKSNKKWDIPCTLIAQILSDDNNVQLVWKSRSFRKSYCMTKKTTQSWQIVSSTGFRYSFRGGAENRWGLVLELFAYHGYTQSH